MTSLDEELADLGLPVVEPAPPPAEASPQHLQVVDESTPPSPIPAQWARFRDRFAEAMEGDRLFTMDQLEQQVLRGRLVFLPGRDAAIIAEVQTYPSGERAMQTLWAVGDLDELMHLAPGLEAMARLMGCGSVLVEGRAGWTRLLKPLGYEPFSVTVRKAL